MIIPEYNKQLNAKEVVNPEEMDKFLGIQSLQKLAEKNRKRKIPIEL
jgi:hypothetical protein